MRYRHDLRKHLFIPYSKCFSLTPHLSSLHQEFIDIIVKMRIRVYIIGPKGQQRSKSQWLYISKYIS